jgi:hypothetical protein
MYITERLPLVMTFLLSPDQTSLIYDTTKELNFYQEPYHSQHEPYIREMLLAMLISTEGVATTFSLER